MAKKFVAIILALCMVFALCCTSFAGPTGCATCENSKCKVPDGIHSSNLNNTDPTRHYQALSLNGKEVGYFTIREIGTHGSNLFVLEKCYEDGKGSGQFIKGNASNMTASLTKAGAIKLNFTQQIGNDGIYFLVQDKNDDDSINAAKTAGILWEMTAAGLRLYKDHASTNLLSRISSYYLVRTTGTTLKLSYLPAVTLFKNVKSANSTHDWVYINSYDGKHHVMICEDCGKICNHGSNQTHNFVNGVCQQCWAKEYNFK